MKKSNSRYSNKETRSRNRHNYAVKKRISRKVEQEMNDKFYTEYMMEHTQ